jgi:hypothetical protein
MIDTQMTEAMPEIGDGKYVLPGWLFLFVLWLGVI